MSKSLPTSTFSVITHSLVEGGSEPKDSQNEELENKIITETCDAIRKYDKSKVDSCDKWITVDVKMLPIQIQYHVKNMKSSEEEIWADITDPKKH